MSGLKGWFYMPKQIDKKAKERKNKTKGRPHYSQLKVTFLVK